MQNFLKDEILKYGNKPKDIVQVKSDPVLAKDENLVEPVEILTFEATDDLNNEVKEVSVQAYAEKMKVVYPKDDVELIDFLNRCKIKGA